MQGDTDRCPYGFGNISSRSIVTGGSSAVLAARDIAAKLRTVAAPCCTPRGRGGRPRRRYGGIAGDGDRRSRSRSSPAPCSPWATSSRGHRAEAGVHADYSPANIRHTPDERGHIQLYTTYPFSMHVSLVEVDAETGVVTPLRHVIAHDCGTVINPAFVDGQVRGARSWASAPRWRGVRLRRPAAPTSASSPTCWRARPTSRRSSSTQVTPSPSTLMGEGRRRGRVRRRAGRGDDAVNDALATSARLARRPRRPACWRRSWRPPVMHTRFAYEAPTA